jgi:hypothetical protein
VYERPYEESHPVVCLDEWPHQLISETRSSFMDKGVKHVDYEYRREGVADIKKKSIREAPSRSPHHSLFAGLRGILLG